MTGKSQGCFFGLIRLLITYELYCPPPPSFLQCSTVYMQYIVLSFSFASFKISLSLSLFTSLFHNLSLLALFLSAFLPSSLYFSFHARSPFHLFLFLSLCPLITSHHTLKYLIMFSHNVSHGCMNSTLSE